MGQDYSTKRRVQGALLADNALYRRTLAKMVAEASGCLHLTMDVICLLGKSEHKLATEQEEEVLRLLTPITKLYTGKRAVSVVSEGIEMLGGQGYMEDTGVARMLRTSQVFPIWEGTTTVLSLDVLRVLQTRPKAFESWRRRVLSAAQESTPFTAQIKDATETIFKYLKAASGNTKLLTLNARELAFSIGQVHIASVLAQYAQRDPQRYNALLEQYLLDHKPLAGPVEQALSQVENVTKDVSREQIVSKL